MQRLFFLCIYLSLLFSVSKGTPKKIGKINVLLLGNTGVGKSYLANNITSALSGIHDEAFKIGHGVKSETSSTQLKTVRWRDLPFEATIIDTPGYADNRKWFGPGHVWSPILTTIEHLQKKLNVVIYCITVANTRIDNNVLQELMTMQTLLGPDIWKNMIIALTQGEQLADRVKVQRKKTFATELYALFGEHGLRQLEKGQIMLLEQDKFSSFIDDLENFVISRGPCFADLPRGLEFDDPQQIKEYIEGNAFIAMSVFFRALFPGFVADTFEAIVEFCQTIISNALPLKGETEFQQRAEWKEKALEQKTNYETDL